MALNIQLSTNLIESKVHLMPCKIDFDGPAKVSEYFETYVDRKTLINGEEVLTGSFRGYPLHGKEVEVPETHKGIVVTETRNSLRDEKQKNATASKKFSSFIYWNWDIPPSKNDPYQKMSDWISMSEVIHSD